MVLVIDTNVLLSASMFSNSIPGRVVKAVFSSNNQVIATEKTIAEVVSKFSNKKFSKYFSSTYVHEFIRKYKKQIITVEMISHIEDCRDPKDNMFLELAIDGKADCIISGDPDLLALHPFRGIPILSPHDFMEQYLDG